MTDEHTRVLNAERPPIRGRYAVGNDAASLMGSNDPGAGITCGPALTFGRVVQEASTMKTLALRLLEDRLTLISGAGQGKSQSSMTRILRLFASARLVRERSERTSSRTAPVSVFTPS